MKLKPLGNRVTVIQKEKENVINGIIVPKDLLDNNEQGEVVAVGDRCEDIKIGDTILYNVFGTSRIVIDKVEFFMMKEENIAGIIHE